MEKSEPDIFVIINIMLRKKQGFFFSDRSKKGLILKEFYRIKAHLLSWQRNPKNRTVQVSAFKQVKYNQPLQPSISKLLSLILIK